MMTRGKSSLKKSLHRWSQAIETIYELKNGYPQRVLVITFENLVLSPEKTMDTICRFLGLLFQRRMVEGYQYNPKYPERKLDEEKAFRHKREGIDFGLAEKLPSAHGKYQELIANSQQAQSNLSLDRF